MTVRSHFSSLSSVPDAPPQAVSPAAGGLPAQGSTITFEVTGVPLCIVNAVRRTIIADLPVAALYFDPDASARTSSTQASVPFGAGNWSGPAPRAHLESMRFLKNTTPLHNEFIGHRLAMVPIHLDENQLRSFDPSQYHFVLHVKNATSDVMTVTSADITALDNAGVKYPQPVRDAMFPYSPWSGGHVVLARLRPTTAMLAGTGMASAGVSSAVLLDGVMDELHVECSATLGCGRDDARFIPVSSCHFWNKPDPAAAEEALQAKLSALSASSQGGDGTADAKVQEEERMRVTRQHATLDVHRYFVPDTYVFSICSETCLRPAYMVFLALRILAQRVRRLEDTVRAAVPTSPNDEDAASAFGAARVLRVPHMPGMYHVIIYDEDHTLGNLLQGCLYNLWVGRPAQESGDDADGATSRVNYVGYTVPHPLERVVILKVQVDVGLVLDADATVCGTIAHGMARVADELEDLTQEWVRFAGLQQAKAVGGRPLSAVVEWMARRQASGKRPGGVRAPPRSEDKVQEDVAGPSAQA